MENLKNELKLKLIDALNLEGMTPEDIDDNAPLFGDEGLGLDSIDVLELIVLLEKNYGIRLATPAEGKAVFRSIAVMADYVAANRSK
ncbi:MAG: acyl carrier protein [Bacteroidales bacterium]|jgi:acyl carrier protein|nr:acyl carrier protein [Bacteroidales bacterium]